MPRQRFSRPEPYRSKDKPLRWMGEWHVYRKVIVGGVLKEKRVHRGPRVLGLCSALTKAEAQQKLDKIIAEDRNPDDQKPEELTVEWAIRKYVALKKSKWAQSTRITNEWLTDKHIIPGVGLIPLADCTRDVLQTWLDSLAETKTEKGTYPSRSMLHKCRTILKAVFDEMIELDHMGKNPARKLQTPRSLSHKATRYLTPEECAKLLAACGLRDHLILSLMIVCGFRPGELFALRRNDHDTEAHRLRVDETTWEGKMRDEAKTLASIGYVHLPPSLELELRRHMDRNPGSPDAFLFPSRTGGPMRQKNYLRRDLKRISEAAGLAGITQQALRRTTATLAQKHGTVKDHQAMLRHATPQMTIGVYMQQIPESVRAVVNALDAIVRPGATVH